MPAVVKEGLIPLIAISVFASYSVRYDLFRRRLKLMRRSDPRIGILTWATVNFHINLRLNPNSSLNVRSPYVSILVPFAA